MKKVRYLVLRGVRLCVERSKPAQRDPSPFSAYAPAGIGIGGVHPTTDPIRLPEFHCSLQRKESHVQRNDPFDPSADVACV